MIAETLAIISLLALVAIFILKIMAIWQDFNKQPLYPPMMAYVSFAIGMIAWLLFFMSINSIVLNQDLIVTPTGQVYEIGNENYQMYAMYLSFSNMFFYLLSFMTVLETLLLLKNSADTKRYEPRRAFGGALNARK